MKLIFILLVVYQLKHFLADYPLQGKYMLGKFLDKGWVRPLLAHVSVHGAMTFLIAVACGKLALFAMALACFDGGIHFVMDRIKAGKRYLGRYKPLTADLYKMHAANLAYKGVPGLEPTYENSLAQIRGNTYFWWSLGLDQMVHHLTHYACIYALLTL